MHADNLPTLFGYMVHREERHTRKWWQFVWFGSSVRCESLCKTLRNLASRIQGHMAFLTNMTLIARWPESRARRRTIQQHDCSRCASAASRWHHWACSLMLSTSRYSLVLRINESCVPEYLNCTLFSASSHSPFFGYWCLSGGGAVCVNLSLFVSLNKFL